MRADHHPSTSSDDLVVVPRADLDALAARADTHEAEAEALRARLDALERRVGLEASTAARVDAGSGASDGEVTDPPAVIGRRRALAGLAGAAAGAATVVGTAQPAAAANGDNMKIAFGNTATGGTALRVQGTTASHGFAVSDDPALTISSLPAIVGMARGTRFRTGVLALAEGTANGVVATVGGSGAGVVATVNGTGDGVRAFSLSGDGGNFGAARPAGGANGVISIAQAISSTLGNVAFLAIGDTQLRLDPNSRPSPPTGTHRGFVGDLRWSAPSTGVSDLWACIGAGTPGVWRKLVGLGTAGAFHLLPTPVRVYDSRPNTAPAQGPKTPLPEGNVARTIDLTVNGSTVPAGATGVVLTVLLSNAEQGPGNLTVWAADKPKPGSNTLIWGGSAGRFTTLAMSAVDAQAQVKVDASLQTNLILDVVGYYR